MNEFETYERPPLRYRRLGGGYRRADVEYVLSEFRVTLRQLDSDLESLRERNREIEAELDGARTDLEGYRAKEREFTQAMTSALWAAAQIEEGAQRRAAEIITEAEAAAVRVREEASRHIEESGAQFNQLLRLKDNLLDAMRGVVTDFDDAISRVRRGEQLFPPRPEVEERDAADAPAPAPAPAAVTAHEPHPAIVPAAVPRAEPPQDEQVFETRVELDAGPFPDYAPLAAFERALVHLPRVEDVYVRRLAGDRALIELMLSEPAALIRTMRESLPYSLEVRSANGSKLVVDVDTDLPVPASAGVL
jgi:hypothetical protein